MTSAWMPAAANSSLDRSGVFVFEAQLGDDWLFSDETWRVRSGAGFSEPAGAMHANAIGGGVPSEVFDARALPHDWRAAGFDDSTWGAGTHVHGWSSTPARDLVFYTLGVTPAEPVLFLHHSRDKVIHGQALNIRRTQSPHVSGNLGTDRLRMSVRPARRTD